MTKEQFALPTKYLNEVMDYLEYLGYDEWILPYNEVQVAHSVTDVIYTFYKSGASVRMAALCIFGITFEVQIIPDMKRSSKGAN